MHRLFPGAESDVGVEPRMPVLAVEAPTRTEPPGPVGEPIEVVGGDAEAATYRVEGGDGEHVARGAAPGDRVQDRGERRRDRVLRAEREVADGDGDRQRAAPNTGATNGSKRPRSGQMTSTSSGRSEVSATNRWPRASRSTSSWRIVPWQACTWTLASDVERANGVGGRSARRSAWRCASSVDGAAGDAPLVVSTATGAGRPRTSAAVSLLWRPHDWSSGWLSAGDLGLAVAAADGGRGRLDRRRSRPGDRGRMQQRDVHVADVTEGREHAELRAGQGADTEDLDAGGQFRLDVAAAGAPRCVRAGARPERGSRCAGGPAPTARTATPSPPVRHRRAARRPPLSLRRRRGPHRAVAADAALPLAEYLRPGGRVAVEEVGDLAGDGEPCTAAELGLAARCPHGLGPRCALASRRSPRRQRSSRAPRRPLLRACRGPPT